MDWLEAAKLFAAGLTGGAVVPYLTDMRERRAARAAVGEQIAAVETARWAGGDASFRELRTAINTLEARALIAGLPKEAVTMYGRLALVGRAASEAELELYGGDEHAGESAWSWGSDSTRT